jgi:type II secretory pathway pseudopilin PulG
VELMIAMLIFIILIAVVILVTQGFFSKARESALDVDLHSVKTAVDTYAIQSGKWPTANSSLPPSGQYAPIDFNASFDNSGKIMSFYPHFISKLPRHWDDEPKVWRIDSAALVSIDMDRDKY